jgi:MoxR-vWA-beta-propeller ternary system domain bpX4
MDLASFLGELFEHGRVRVPRTTPESSPGDLLAADRVLREAEHVRRLEFPGSPPDWHAESAGWSAEMFYRACQLAAQRDAAPALLKSALGAPCPNAPPASRHYSVDLVFRFLPDLYKLASGVAKEDPLLAILDGWAMDWPLSSVGVKVSATLSLDALLADAGLFRWYVQRIIARRDVARMTHPAVFDGVRAALGSHIDLAPELAACLAAQDGSAANLPPADQGGYK